MKNTSYIIMWLTIFLVLILAMVLALVLLLLAELYCSPLIHRHRRRQLNLPTTTAATTTGNNSLTHSPQHTHVSDPLHDTEKQLPDQSLPETQHTVQKGCGLTDSVNGCSLIYISNPIYGGDGNGTPFETPDSSPSRLETEDCSSSGDDEKEEVSSNVVGTMMEKKKKVCVKDVGLLGTSGSDNTNGVSSCSLTTPCTSPSL
ncbi:hypothetical protein HanPI659440_Chr10g0398681 [Helianthus annuus]|nr:hypothetical protein HanPI659440_Chr10g0398681 [Helianthus annuus]